jgi:hypothetical protein
MDDKRNPPKTYEVGHGKPPLHTRFVKGRSGNPSGKRRRPQDLIELLQRILGERVEIAERGKRKRITKLEAIAKQVVNRSAAGERAWLQALLPLLERDRLKATLRRENAGTDRSTLDLTDQEARDALDRLSPKERDQLFALCRKARGDAYSFPEDGEDDQNCGDRSPIPEDEGDDQSLITGMAPKKK